jgi:hypothetical protein
MSVLLDMENWPANPSIPTVNKDHVRNPQRRKFLDANMVGDSVSHGLGQDGVYRDPWGTPYVITMDLNADEKTRDCLYCNQAVSEDATSGSTPKAGLNGLIPKIVGGSTVYEVGSDVMVWSAGPDKQVDPNAKATAGANKDNVLSWKD